MKFTLKYILPLLLSLTIASCGSSEDPEIQDIQAPTITLIGDANLILTLGDAYQEPGSFVTDNIDTGLTVNITGSVDTSEVDSYLLTYTAVDLAGNSSSVTRTIVVEAAPDSVLPIISLVGEATINLVVGDAYVEQGTSVTDNIDTNLSAAVTGSVDTSTAGTYIITYTATDFAANEATITRTIIVVDVTPEPLSDAFIFHSDNADTFPMEYWGDTFGTGTEYTDQPTDTTYAKALEISKSDSWGTVIAWGNEAVNSIDISAYTHARFKVKTDTFTQVDVRVLRTTSGNEVVYNLSSGTDLGNGWIEMQVPIPDYIDMTWFVLNFRGGVGTTVLLADVYFTTLEAEPVVGPAQAAPVPASFLNDEVVVLYSDSLAQDGFVGVWDANWFQAPVYSEGNVDGNNYAKYQITAGGVEGGVVGLEFGFENGSLDAASKTTWNFDLFVEADITKISLQLVSDDGAATYVINTPTTGEWVNYSLLYSDLTNNDATGKDVLNTGVLQAIGIQLWGTAGQSVYVDNIYFSGESTTYDLTVSVTDDDNALAGATVSVGNVTATTNGSGVAILTLHEAAHKVFVDADGFGIGQGNQTIAGGDASLAMSVIPINAGPSAPAPSPTASNDDAFVLYSDALTVDRSISFWSDNWFNAPTFSQISIQSDNIAKLQIIPAGISGGITGIQYGVQGGPVNVSTATGLRFDLYATAGITQVGFQMVSTVGPAVSPLDPVVTGQWITIELPFADYPSNFNPENMTQFGVQLWGTTSDAVYIDNIYFYK